MYTSAELCSEKVVVIEWKKEKKKKLHGFFLFLFFITWILLFSGRGRLAYNEERNGMRLQSFSQIQRRNWHDF